MGCHALLYGVFPTQGLNSGLLHCKQTLCHLIHQGSPRFPLAIYFIHGNVYISMLLSQFIPPSSPSMSTCHFLCLHLYSCPSNSSIKILQIVKYYINIRYDNDIITIIIEKLENRIWDSRIDFIYWGLGIFCGLIKKMLRMKFFVCLWYYIFILRPINFLSHLVHVIVTHVHIPIPQIN